MTHLQSMEELGVCISELVENDIESWKPFSSVWGKVFPPLGQIALSDQYKKTIFFKTKH